MLRPAPTTLAVLCAALAAAGSMMSAACSEHGDNARQVASASGGAPGSSAVSGGATAYGPGARAACDSVAVAWRAIPGIEVAATDTAFEPISENAPLPGCHVMAVAKLGVDSAHADLDYWSQAQKGRWLPLWRYSADGPDGGVLTWERTGVRCEVRQSIDGGDDSDSTYVPSPETSEETFCWRYTGPPTLRDTLRLNDLPPAPAGAIVGTVMRGAIARPGKRDSVPRIRPDPVKRRP